MESIFRKKARPRQSADPLAAVPYDRLAPASRSPPAVATVNHGLRAISAPSSNPALSVDGTEFNRFTMHRRRDRLTTRRPGSPSTSVSTADSSTLSDDSLPSTSSATSKLPPNSPQSSKSRRSEAISLPSPPDTAPPDSVLTTPRSAASVLSNHPSASTPTRPSSGMTVRSDANRMSKYSIASPDSASNHSHVSSFYHGRHHHADSFVFPRPENDEAIEALFESIKRSRDLGDMPHLSIDQKWSIVHSDEHMRWAQKKDTNKPHETGHLLPESPEWYISKFLDKTITAKQAAGLSVSLRSNELG